MINFNNSLFFYEPFPHSILRNVIEENNYNKICSEFPETNMLNKMQDKREGEKKFSKYNLSNTGKDKRKFFEILNQSKTIKKFYDYLNSKVFLENLVKFLLKNHIDLKINPNQNFKNYLINKLLKRELKINFEFSAISSNNGFILPHTDGPNKIIGFVLSVIDNIDILKAKKLGTQILTPTENAYKFNYFNKSVPFSKTLVVKEIPFEKNQISLHIKTFNSLHAVGPIDQSNLKKEIFRKSINFFLEK